MELQCLLAASAAASLRGNRADEYSNSPLKFGTDGCEMRKRPCHLLCAFVVNDGTDSCRKWKKLRHVLCAFVVNEENSV